MRVDYMLPGLFPQANPELTRLPGGQTGLSYPTLPVGDAPGVSWRDLLGLTPRQAALPALRAPVSRRTELDRFEWRIELSSTLHLVAGELEKNPPDSKPLRDVESMLQLLLHYEDLAERLAHQTLTERRG